MTQLLPPIAEYYAEEAARIRAEFEAADDGVRALRARSDLVDSIVIRLYRELLSPALDGPKGFCVVALGGYGRRELFPHSDVDLLFLWTNGKQESSQREGVAAIARALWDTRMRVSHTTRTLGECGQLHRHNLEFNIALLDCRYLVGDRWLFDRLRSDAVPHFAARDRDELVRNLTDLIEERHAKHGHTVFHLEPNIKEAPGGLRDYHVARWLTLIAEIETQGRMVVPEEIWPPPLRAGGQQAWEFLASLRCFLHYRYGRDDNLLSYEYQEEAARLGIGHEYGQAISAADWMRSYFRHARAISQLSEGLLDEVSPARSGLYGMFQQWRSRLSSPDFSVVRERIFPRQPALAADERLLLDLFEMVARHGLALSREAERWVEDILAHLALEKIGGLWPALSRILSLPHAVAALRAMHRLGVLTALLPEFRSIDCLVIRDYFHRYTVDEHSLTAIQSLQELRKLRGEVLGGAGLERWRRKLAEILAEVERPDLVAFALLLHDVGKGMTAEDHIVGSLAAADSACERLKLSPDERETVRSLIASHLEMSATLQRRDIFDPETVKSFAENIGSVERLKLLTLFTYADVKSVSAEVLTPWKAEMLWRLYATAANYLVRSLDDARLHVAEAKPPKAQRVLALLGASARRADVEAFLEGFPVRYLETHAAEEIAVHFSMARQLAEAPVQVALRARDRFFELTLLTADRPFLFASITGTLAAWGMNILKADAFANRAGTVLDTFRFVDLHRTLEMNPQEVERFKRQIVDVLGGRVLLGEIMKGRMNNETAPRPKIVTPTQVRFDDVASSHSTLMELITSDRAGLLYHVSSTLAELGCNIEVALIDTEGQKAIDVFYLTHQGAKLDAARQARIREALLERIATPTTRPMVSSSS